MSIMFVKINVGHTVFDELKRVRGKVVSINSNKAELETEDGTVSSNLSDLVIVNEEDMESMKKSKLEIKIKYFNNELTKIKKISQGDWIDLRASVDVELEAGEFNLIPLGVAMELPEGYEAVVAPRSSTFKNFGIIETNSIGVIDNSYSGNDDQWFFPAYALRDTVINFDERICQFRIQKRMPEINFTEVELLEGENRGGLGSTGVK